MNPNSFKCESDPNLTKRQNALRAHHLEGIPSGDVIAVAVRFVNNNGTPRSNAYTFGLPSHVFVPSSGDLVIVPTPSGLSVAVVEGVRVVSSRDIWFKEWIVALADSSDVREACATEVRINKELKEKARTERRIIRLRKKVMDQREALSNLAKESDKAVAELGAYVMDSAVLDVVELSEVRARATNVRARMGVARSNLGHLEANLAKLEASL